MASFKDASGKEWSVSLDAPAIMAIRAECDPDFMLEREGQEGTYDRLQRDPVLLCRVIYHVCAKQRLSSGITEQAFYEQVIGDAIDAASQALLDAMLLFTPKRSRDLAKAIAAKTDRVAELGMARVMARLNDPAMEAQALAMLDQKIDEAMRIFSTRQLPASSTPASAE